MSFYALDFALVVSRQLAPIEAKVRRSRKSLADEIARAGDSVALNLSEGRLRVGLDRPDLFRRAAGSASELATALRCAALRTRSRHHHYR
jgi:four helix bundle protein